MAPDASKKRLALAILNFLAESVSDGTVAQDDAESIEIASNCIAEAFKVDPNDKAAMTDALGGQTLVGIYGVYEKLKGKSTASTAGISSASEARPATPAASTPSAPPAKNEEAEQLKAKGNAAMAAKDYNTAIDFYTQAITLSPTDPIYLSNRAAAYSGLGQYEEAAQDAEMAVAGDPKYTKAWSRLGLARYALGDMKAAMDAYKSGVDAEGNGGSPAMKKGYETAKRRYEEEQSAGDGPNVGTRGGPGAGAGGMPDLSSLASMLGGGGAGGAGGMPDFSQIMNNPMMRQMAQNMMSNPEAMNSILNNPRLREMAEQFGAGGGQGGGMPDFSSLMNDPSIAEMARNFMGGRGAGGPGTQ